VTQTTPFDHVSQFEKIKKDVIASFTKALDIQATGTNRKIVVRNVWIDDDKAPEDWESQRDAVRKDKTWGVPVYAALDLVDRKTGEVISSTNKKLLATLPKTTDIGSFIVEGKHYQVQHQLRRKPGVYIAQKENGEMKTEVNIARQPFDITYDAKKGIFKLMRGTQDGSGVALYPILSRIGVSDSAMAKAWGADVLAANKAVNEKNSTSAVLKAGEYFTKSKHDSPDAAAKAIATFFEDETEVRPEVTKATIGKAFTKVGPEMLLSGTTELLKLERGERDADDRHALEFKKVMNPGDLINERMVQSSGELAESLSKLRVKIGYRLNDRKSVPNDIGKLINSNELSGVFSTFFTGSSLSNTTDQTNPINMINGSSKITITGEGGVQDERAIWQEEHTLHPSHMGFIDPIHTPDASTIGISLNLPIGSAKEGDSLQAKILDVRTGAERMVGPADMREMTVAFPDQYKDGKPINAKVKAMVKGEMQMVKATSVDAVMQTSQQAFSMATNTIPFLASIQGVRGQMATKMIEQALPLTNREAPLVQVKVGKGTIEDAIGSKFSVAAKADGVIEKIDAKRITIRTADGLVEQPLYDNLPLNGKSFLHSDTVVKVGDAVKKGDILADSNFTDGGTLALGTNLRAAYIPYKGYNFEDGIVITESAAKKLSSEHLHEHAHSIDKGDVSSKGDYLAWNSTKLSPEQRDMLDDDGVVRKGQIVSKGDPLWVGTRENKYDAEYLAFKKIAPKTTPRRGHMEEWSNDASGTVVDVVKEGKKVKIYVKTEEPAQIGDKITNRHGAKGIITKIISDGEAPYTQNADGTSAKVDILLNPHGIVTRMNPSQILETAAAKLAVNKGSAYIVDNFNGQDHSRAMIDELAVNGVSDTETLYDPHSKDALGEVLVGPQYVLKLAKQATSQFSSRESGAYDINKAPMRGGEDGAKALDLLAFYSMLSHGSRANLREMATHKGSQNEHFWNWLAAGHKSGQVAPAPQPTFAYKKFEAYLNGAGVNTKRNGSKNIIQPMTDKEVDLLSSGAIKDPVFVRAKDLSEEPGGLMDTQIFGGRLGDRWGHIELAEPIANPVFEQPIKKLTGMNATQYAGLVKGNLFVDPETGEWAEQGLTGGEAFKKKLGMIDVDADIKAWTDRAKTAKTAPALDDANKRLKYLHALKKIGIRPEDAYVQTKIPVIPPQFRQINETDDGQISNAGLNTLYRDVSLVSNELAWQKTIPYMPEGAKSELRQNLYDGIAAIYGIGDPIAKYPKTRMPRGIIDQIKGEKAAKEGFFINNVLRRNQDYVGRGTIIPEPKLGLDEVGLPEEMSWNIFRPFVIRRLVNSAGKDPVQASKEYDARTPTARAALVAEMDDHPVLLNRAPSLHKFSMMAFKPTITDGKAVKIPPLVVKGFNADFDGDAMTVHVPILPDAIEEARRMLPSRNLYNPGTGQIMMQPQNEAALGLYLMSRDPAQKGKIADALPESMREQFADVELNKHGLKALTTTLAETMPRDYGKVLDKLKQAGEEHTYRTGFTVSMKDLVPDLPGRRDMFRRTSEALGKIDLTSRVGREEGRAVTAAANIEHDAIVKNGLKGQANSLDLMVQSGARGNANQLKQTLSTPFMVDDHRSRPSPFPVMNSFAEGLPFSDYWSTLYGARATAVDRQLQTAKPGEFNKDIMATAMTTVVAAADCGTRMGLDVRVESADAEDRFLAKDISVKGDVIAHAGSQVTSTLLSTLRNAKVATVDVRSPITCKLPKGVCAKCYGLDEHGGLPAIGDNVGATSGQAMSEPLVQMTMRTFHSGGISGTRGIVSGYDKIDKLLKMPKIKSGRATLSLADGTVDSVTPSIGGTGQDVKIGSKTHYISNDLWDSKRVHVGAVKRKGDILSGGIAQPNELADLKGMRSAQEYLADEIQSAYQSQGVDIKRRAIETVVRAVGNTTKIIDPGDSAFIYGDTAPWTVVEDFNSKKLGKKSLRDAHGFSLQEDAGGVSRGTVIDDRVQRLLEKSGLTSVETGNSPILHRPFLKGIQQIPMLRDDWMSQMGYRELKDAIVEGAARGAESDFHGYSPIPGFAYGAEFGEDPDGRSLTEGVY